MGREYDRIQKSIDTAYADKLDGHIDTEMFARMSKEWRSWQNEITEQLASLEKAARIYVDDGIAILDLCQRASELFRVQTPDEKRRLIDVVCLNSKWSSQALDITLRKPFDLLADSVLSIKASPRGQYSNLDSLLSALILPDAETLSTYALLKAS